MFSVGFSELILILVIAYVFVGPQDLPKVARWLGRVVRRARMLISEIKQEAGLAQLEQETERMRKDINAAVKENKDIFIQSISGVQEEIDEIQKELKEK